MPNAPKMDVRRINLKASRNAMGTRRKAHPPPTTKATTDPMTPTISESADRISVGRSAPTIFAASQTGVEKTTMNPTCTTMAGRPDMLKFIRAALYGGEDRAADVGCYDC